MREAAAAMRTAVVEREELPAEVEHHDRAVVDLDQLALAGRNLIDGGNDVGGHGKLQTLNCSPDERSEIRERFLGMIPHIASLMRATANQSPYSARAFSE